MLTIPHLRELFDYEVELLDHTMRLGAAVAVVAHDPTVIEKHFTLRRSDGGGDSTFSLELEEVRALVAEKERARPSLGHASYGPRDAECLLMVFRRSIYVFDDRCAGGVLTTANLRCVEDVRRGTPMDWRLLG